MPNFHPPLRVGHYYHITNQGIDHRTTFESDKEFRRFLIALQYYNHCDLDMKLSRLLRLNPEDQENVMRGLSSMSRTTILAYCLMPNHFHLLVRQDIENGIASLLSLVENSHTRAFNQTHHRKSCLFLDQFTAVHITSEHQLIHTSRYIHLNPYADHVVPTVGTTIGYPYSSLQEYLSLYPSSQITDSKVILNQFSSPQKYAEFVFSRAPLQRHISQVKHAVAS